MNECIKAFRRENECMNEDSRIQKIGEFKDEANCKENECMNEASRIQKINKCNDEAICTENE